MVAVSQRTAHVSGLPAEGEGSAGGDPGPFTAMGIYHGIKAAVRHKLGKDSLAGVHIAVQGAGSVGGSVARLLAQDGAKLTLADIHAERAAGLASELGASVVASEAIMSVALRRVQPQCAGGDVLTREGIARLDCANCCGRGEQSARAARDTAPCSRSAVFSMRPTM